MTDPLPIDLSGLPIEVLRDLLIRMSAQIREMNANRPRRPRGQPRKYDRAAVIEAVRNGTAIKDCGVPRDSAYQIVWAHEKATGERLPRMKRGLPKGSQNPERTLRIVAAYRELGTFELAGTQFGITCERVRQIVARYERETGDKLPRTPADHMKGIKRPELTIPRVLWRCAGGCGKERMMLPRAAAAHARCHQCASRAPMTQESRDKMGISLTASWADPVVRARRSAAMKSSWSGNYPFDVGSARCSVSATGRRKVGAW